MTIKEAVNKSHQILPMGSRSIPCKLLKVSHKQYYNIINGKVREKAIYPKALHAIEQTATNNVTDAKNNLLQIQTIISQTNLQKSN